MEVAADAIARWLDLAPEAILLCTSRIALRLRGERTLVLGALEGGPGVAEIVGVRVAVREGSALRERINRALLELKQEGEASRLKAEWFGAT